MVLAQSPRKECLVQIQIAFFFVAKAMFPSLWVFWLDTSRTRPVCAAKEKSHTSAKKMVFFSLLGKRADKRVGIGLYFQSLAF